MSRKLIEPFVAWREFFATNVVKPRSCNILGSTTDLDVRMTTITLQEEAGQRAKHVAPEMIFWVTEAADKIVFELSKNRTVSDDTTVFLRGYFPFCQEQHDLHWWGAQLIYHNVLSGHKRRLPCLSTPSKTQTIGTEQK